MTFFTNNRNISNDKKDTESNKSQFDYWENLLNNFIFEFESRDLHTVKSMLINKIRS